MNSLTIGLCTVSTRRENYLSTTVDSLLRHTNSKDRQGLQIVIFDCDAMAQESDQIQAFRTRFQTEISVGLIQLIRTQPTDYPDLSTLPPFRGETPSRIHWRTKQCLDYSLIFQHCAGKGSYYLHLEDDIVCEEDFYKKMWIDIQRLPEAQWSALQFCELGFIGILFKDADLPKLATFFRTFAEEMPVDWLIEHFYAIRRRNGQEFIRLERSLFQHIGYYSSLQEKTSPFQSKSFGHLSFHDRLWAWQGTRGLSKLLSRGFLQYRRMRFHAKQWIKQGT